MNTTFRADAGTVATKVSGLRHGSPHESQAVTGLSRRIGVARNVDQNDDPSRSSEIVVVISLAPSLKIGIIVHKRQPSR